MKSSSVCSILRNIYTDFSSVLTRHTCWEELVKLMSLSPLARFHKIFHYFTSNVNFIEFQRILRYFLWLETIVYYKDELYSMYSSLFTSL